MKGLDLRKFSKVHSDKESSTLKHPDGHEIKIFHKALDPKTMKSLQELPAKKMADGGQAKGSNFNLDSQGAKDFSKGANEPVNPSLSEVWHNLKDAVRPSPKPAETYGPGMAEGGDVSKDANLFDEQMKANSSSASEEAPMSSVPPQGDAPSPSEISSPPINPFDTADTTASAPQMSSEPSQPGLQLSADATKYASQPTPPPAAQAPQASAAPQEAPPQSAQQGLGEQKAGVPDPYGIQATQNALYGGINEQRAGFQQEANALRAQGAAEQKIQTEAHQKLADLQSNYQSHLSGLEQERQNLQEDIKNSHIDPKRYIDNMSTGSRIASSIGLMLSGLGGIEGVKLANGNIQANIDRDIAAQKADLGKKENLLSNNLAQFHNLREATDMTRVQTNDMIDHQLNAAKAGAMGPIAQAKAHQLSGQLQTQNAQVLGQMAMRKTLLSGMANGQVRPEAAVTMLVPQEQRAGAIKELQDAQNHKTLLNDTLSSFDQMAKMNTIGQNVAHPFDNPAAVKALRGAVLDKLTKDTSGRVTPETVKLIGGMFDTLGHSTKTVQQMRGQLSKILNQGSSYPILQTYGINPFANPNSNSPIPKGAPVTGK